MAITNWSKIYLLICGLLNYKKNATRKGGIFFSL